MYIRGSKIKSCIINIWMLEMIISCSKDSACGGKD